MKDKLYTCIKDYEVEGTTLCSAEKQYLIKNAVPGAGESEEDVAGYCSIMDCENGLTCWTTWMDASEYFDLE